MAVIKGDQLISMYVGGISRIQRGQIHVLTVSDLILLPLQISLCDTKYFDRKNRAFYSSYMKSGSVTAS